MNYVKVPAEQIVSQKNQAAFAYITSQPWFLSAINAGGWVAGGFARAILTDTDLVDYLIFRPTIGGTTPRPGDIDFFFPSVEAAKAASESKYKLHPSIGGFAAEGRSSFNSASLTYQFVTDPRFCHGKIEDCLDRFDFLNCKVAFDGTHFIYPEGWHELEKSRLIKITSDESPFLASRILKYLDHRGYLGITSDSIDVFQDWLTRVASDSFTGYTDRHKLSFESHIDKLSNKPFFRAEDVILFLGKWRTMEYERTEDYGSSRSVRVDWALKKLAEKTRNNNVGAMP